MKLPCESQVGTVKQFRCRYGLYRGGTRRQQQEDQEFRPRELGITLLDDLRQDGKQKGIFDQFIKSGQQSLLFQSRFLLSLPA